MTGAAKSRRVACLLVVPTLAVLAACGGEPPPPDPVTTAYCDTVARVQAEQSAPGAGQRGLAASSEATRRQNADLVRTAPPEIAEDWRTVQRLTDRSLASLAATRGDPRRIDRAGLERLRRESEPAAGRIRALTEQRCGVTFRAPGAGG